MFNHHNEATVANYPKDNDTVVQPTQVQQKQPSLNDDVMSGQRKTPNNMDNNYRPNKKAKVDYEAKVDRLDHTATATATATTATSIPVATAFNSKSLNDGTNGSGLSVNDQDVLCGRGKGKPHSHIGSVNYRRLVSANKVITPSPVHVQRDFTLTLAHYICCFSKRLCNIQ